MDVGMSVNERCRFCHKNLKVQGVISHSAKIFEKTGNAKTVFERLVHLGLTLTKTPEKSIRTCQKCTNLLSRIERDLPVFRRWEEEEKQADVKEGASTSTADKSYQEPVTQFCPNPPNLSLTTVSSARLSITEVMVSTSTMSQFESTGGSAFQIFPAVRHVACQTDPPERKSVSTQLIMETPKLKPPERKSVGTQLSMKTLQNRFRSTATQVRVSSRNCGVCTLGFPLDSPLLLLQPTIVKRPSKRPRLSLTDEEEGPSECSLSMVVCEPEGST